MNIGNDYETMSVKELIAKLSQYPDNMPVILTWEGQYICIEDSNNYKDIPYINVENVDGHGECLVINAEGEPIL